MVVAVTVNVAVVLPAATVTEGGVVRALELSERATVVPPAGAAAFNVTVHVDDPPPTRDVGVQFSALRAGNGCGAAVTIPARPFIGREEPPGVAPKVLATLIVVLATPGARVTETTAATPFCITVVLIPARRHA